MSKKTSTILIIIIFLITLFSSLLFCEIKAVEASSSYSSFNPMGIYSSKQRLHLFFLHEIRDFDVVTSTYYHCYKMEQGDWSNPVKLIDSRSYTPKIIEVIEIDTGLMIYYQKWQQYESSLYYKLFNEEINQWSDELPFFTRSNIADYFGISTKLIDDFEIFSTELLTNNTLGVVRK